MSYGMRILWPVPISVLGVGVALMRARLNPVVAGALESIGGEIESYAKANHPWNNITGAAEAGLNVQVESSGNQHRLQLSHSVHYGIWLEVRWAARYAVILPTLQAHYAAIMDRIRQAIGG